MSYRVASIIALVGVVLLSSAAMGMASAERADALTGDAVTATSATVDPKAGVIRIEGTVRCSEEDGELVLIDPIVVSQIQGNHLVTAYDETGVLCSTDGSSSFSVQMAAFDPETGERLRFHPGIATVSGVSYSSAGSGFFGPISVRLEPSRFFV